MVGNLYASTSSEDSSHIENKIAILKVFVVIIDKNYTKWEF